MSNVAFTHEQDPEKSSPPPAYYPSHEVTVYPTTVAHSTRYAGAATANDLQLDIPPGVLLGWETEQGHTIISVPQSLLSPWVRHTHPEGAIYYHNAILNIVTDSQMECRSIFDKVTAAAKAVDQLASNYQGKLPHSSELYITAGDDSDSPCGYYLVDHDTQTEFWLGNVNTADMGFQQISSLSHLKHALQEQYWTHIEYFPHQPVSQELRGELAAVLRHGQLDHMTSRSSTFPYDIEQCEKFLKILSMTNDDATSSYTTCIIARIWSTIAKHRFDNLYGEQCARLDRDQRVREKLSNCDSYLIRIASALLFGMNKPITTEIDGLYVDNMVYTMHWRSFMRKMIDSWRDCRLTSIGLIIGNAILLVQPVGRLTNYVGIAAIALSTLAFVSTIALLNKFHEASEHTASEAADVLCDLEHPTYRFQPIGLAYSLPKALVTWSTILLTTEIFSMIVEISGASLSIALIVVFGIVALLLALKLVKMGTSCVRGIWARRRCSDSSVV